MYQGLEALLVDMRSYFGLVPKPMESTLPQNRAHYVGGLRYSRGNTRHHSMHHYGRRFGNYAR